MIDDERPDSPEEQPTPGGDDAAADAPDPSAAADPSESPAAGEEGGEAAPEPSEGDAADEAPAEAEAAPAEAEAADAPAPAADEPPVADDAPAEAEAADAPAPAAGEPPAAGAPAEAEGDAPAERPKREKRGKDEKKAEPEVVPGAHLEPDLVLEADRQEVDEDVDRYAQPDDDAAADATEGETTDGEPQPTPRSALDLAADARYRATGKRKTAVARVILRPGDGGYSVNGRSLEDFFPRAALQKAARQPLEVAGFERRMDVIARIHGGGVSAQAGALRHGVARALVEADPALRPELKRRGLLTRDARAKERKKAGLKKARKRPQFSKR